MIAIPLPENLLPLEQTYLDGDWWRIDPAVRSVLFWQNH
jgi:hypothetical protein